MLYKHWNKFVIGTIYDQFWFSACMFSYFKTHQIIALIFFLKILPSYYVMGLSSSSCWWCTSVNTTFVIIDQSFWNNDLWHRIEVELDLGDWNSTHFQTRAQRMFSVCYCLLFMFLMIFLMNFLVKSLSG